MGLVYEDDLSIRPVLTIITPTIRPAGAIEVARSIQRAAPHPWEIRHIIAYWPEPPDRAFARTGQWMTRILRAAGDGWLLVVDDDNRLHPDLPQRLAALIQDDARAGAFVFDSAYPEFGGVLRACPEHMRPGRIDAGQAALRSDLAVSAAWPDGRTGDGAYLASLYRHSPESFRFVGEVLAYHNHQVWGTACVP